MITTQRKKIKAFAAALTEEHLNKLERDLFTHICDSFKGDGKICERAVAEKAKMSVRSFNNVASQLMTLGYLVGEEDAIAGMTHYRVNPLILREDLRNFI